MRTKTMEPLNAEDLCKELGKVVRRRREQRGMKLRDLARASGVSGGNLCKLEKHGLNITIDTLVKIAEALEELPQNMIRSAWVNCDL